MKALILAAGFGSRLLPITDHCPKSLVSVNGKPILFKQIENLYENGITDITVVSGYQADVLERRVKETFPEVHILHSRDYAITNNMYSAWIAKERMGTEGFLMMNADVYFDASVITALLRCPAPNAIVVDVGSYLEESMKVAQEGGRLVRIAKTIPPEEALGASIDVYKLSPEAAADFFRTCERYILEKREKKLWSEVALNDVLGRVRFEACPLEGRWLEIDDLQDLAAAEKLFALPQPKQKEENHHE